MNKLRPSLVLIVAALNFAISYAQEKVPLDHSVYDSWESVGNVSIPYNGKYLLYSVNLQEGDNTLYLYDLQTNNKTALPRGKRPVISIDGQQMIYRIAPTFAQTHKAKVDKKKGPDMPKDTLVVLDLKSRKDMKIPFLSKLSYGKDLVNHIAFSEEKPGKKDTLSPVYVMDINSCAIDTINRVDKFAVSDDGNYLAYISKPDKKDSTALKGLYLRNLSTKETRTLLEGDKKIKIGLPFFEEDGHRLAFYAQKDTAAAMEKYSDIYLFDMASAGSAQASVLVNSSTEGIPQGWMVGEKAELEFFRDALFFGTKPVPEEEDTTIADFEKVKLDVWKWDGDYLPTVVEANKERFDKITYLAAVYFSNPRKVIQIADENVPEVSFPDDLNGDLVMCSTDKPYRVQSQWDSDSHYDFYLVNIRTGEKKLMFKDGGYSEPLASPNGTYYLSYNILKRNWTLFEPSKNMSRDLTSSLDVTFWDDTNDVPGQPGPYSYPIWSEDEKYFLIGDKYDLWQFDPTGDVAPFAITEGLGRSSETTFSIVRPIVDPKAKRPRNYFEANPLKKGESLYFSSFNHKNRFGGIYMKDITKKKSKMTLLEEGPHTYRLSCASLSYEYPGIASISKSNKPPRKLAVPIYIFTKGDFQHPNDIYVTRDVFRSTQQMTQINPQQEKYLWGSVEMVSWMTDDSIPAEGLLYKPENFDPSKKYPMIIYFYEKYSDEIYRYRNPAPSHSTVNFPYFVSNGYLVFVPDIYYGKPGSGQYLDGHPGQCAMRSIMPGVDMLCRNSWVDSEHMAIQGQSWGGYQVAYMITQTDRFAAAGAGAPVSNMTSAYGGIRWGSGVTRQFQYEGGQSRIGVNLWDGFDKYYANSPLFFVPNVKTPVLIMHNDKDTAVPWYQGIEFFTALRRCSKQAWMLQYKGEDHNVMQRHNCKDLSVKLAEFFDHFLKGAPEPEWMKNN